MMDIKNGDTFNIMRLDGLDPMIAWAMGAATGHTGKIMQHSVFQFPFDCFILLAILTFKEKLFRKSFLNLFDLLKVRQNIL